MEKYSLAICKTDPSDVAIISWDDFALEMNERGVKEAIIFATYHTADCEFLEDRQVVGRLVIASDGVEYLDDYCLVDHSLGDHLIPCLVLLDADLNYAAQKSQELWRNKRLIQCRIDPDNGSFSVIERPLITRELLGGISKNIREKGKVSPQDVAKLLGLEHLFDEKEDDWD